MSYEVIILNPHFHYWSCTRGIIRANLPVIYRHYRSPKNWRWQYLHCSIDCGGHDCFVACLRGLARKCKERKCSSCACVRNPLLCLECWHAISGGMQTCHGVIRRIPLRFDAMICSSFVVNIYVYFAIPSRLFIQHKTEKDFVWVFLLRRPHLQHMHPSQSISPSSLRLLSTPGNLSGPAIQADPFPCVSYRHTRKELFERSLLMDSYPTHNTRSSWPF